MYGDALRRRNDVAAAENAYRRAIANDPEFANAYVQLAELLASNGNNVEASVLRRAQPEPDAALIRLVRDVFREDFDRERRRLLQEAARDLFHFLR